jgi:predicted N-acetyltransferase YhbS
MFQLLTLRPELGASPAQGAAILDLIHTVWPPTAGEIAPMIEPILRSWKAEHSAHFVIEDQNLVLAHSRLFRREVLTPQGPLAVGALAGVCVHPNYRGRRWGEAVVRAAFDFLPELGVSVSLFQTGVPRFYEKLGGRVISNRFFNGDSVENPFWDSCEMIFPASFDWPEGPIDLNGPGY